MAAQTIKPAWLPAKYDHVEVSAASFLNDDYQMIDGYQAVAIQYQGESHGLPPVGYGTSHAQALDELKQVMAFTAAVRSLFTR